MASARWLMSFRMPADSTTRAIGYVAALSVFVLFLSYMIERKQSFAVSAITEFLRVETVSEGADDWSLVAAHICMPKQGDLSATQNGQSGEADPPNALTAAQIGIKADCDDTYFDQKTFSLEQAEEELTLSWSDDYILDIQQFDKDALYIYITVEPPADGKDPQPVYFQQTKIPTGSILYIPLTEHESPRLVLRGYMVLGEPPVRSDALVVREGQYEIRQDGRRLRKHVVATGELFPGDRITFEHEAGPVWSRWWTDAQTARSEKIISRVFVSDLVPNVTGFNVVATTDPQFSSIFLTRVGGQPTSIPVSWAQRLTTDPLIAGLVTLLGLIATLLALRNNFFRK